MHLTANLRVLRTPTWLLYMSPQVPYAISVLQTRRVVDVHTQVALCHDPDASGHGTCTTTVCLPILTLFVCSPCAAFVRASPPVFLSMITHCLTRFDCVYQCLNLCSDLCLDPVYKPCVHIVRSQTWLHL